MRLWVLLAVVMVVLTGCPPTCDRSTCTGCCDPTGECLPGTSRNFCGSGGVVCGVCASPQRCRAGACVVPTDGGLGDAGPMLENCSAGCRDGQLDCQPGNLPEACGLDGGVCQQCSPLDRCDFGRCTSMSCSGCIDALGSCRAGNEAFACGPAGALCQACAPGEACSSGACGAAAPCGLASCPNGCCRSNVCLAPTPASCGINGTQCSTCPGALACVNGRCQ
ncbi:MAG: hypothetical protein IAE78_26345 [Myxococcus sp.]|nr:hypothetical protein [Myxococcus sp.]